MANASFWYSKAILKIVTGSIDLDTDVLKVGLSTSTHNPDIDDQYLDDGGADDFVDGEISVSGYVAGFGNSGRKSLVSRTVTEDATNNRVKLDANDSVWTALASVVINQATLLKEVTSNALSPIILNNYIGGVNPLGADFTIQWNTSGIGYFQQ